jgi:L-ascorbate metabolism protein UlaG (beta-lactamase superfamily)
MRTPVFALLALFAAACSSGPATPPATTAPAAPPASATATASAAPVARGTDTFASSKGEIKVTPIFHATVLLEVAGQAIYLDPFSKGDFTGLPKADFVLVTDVHFDHLDAKALDALSKPGTRIVAPKAAADAKELKGRPDVIVLENGKKQSLGLFDVEAVPMYNLTRGPEKGKLFHDKGRGNGYVLTFGDKRFYFSGDTECTPEMKALPAIDVAFVCMNLPYTMPPAEAATCVNAFKPKVLFPYHFAVPGGASSNLDELKSALDPKAGVEVRVRKWY